MRAILVFALLQAAAMAGVVDRVAVVIGDDVITQSEVEEEARVAAFLNGQPLDLGPAARRAAAERIVDQQLIRNEMAVSRFPQPQPAEAEAMLRRFKTARFGTDTGYRRALAQYGISEEDLKAHFRWQLAAMRFTDVRFGPATAATPQQPAPRSTAPRTAARRERPGAVRVPPSNVDEAMDQWLEDTRSRTRIEFKEEAFQ